MQSFAIKIRDLAGTGSILGLNEQPKKINSSESVGSVGDWQIEQKWNNPLHQANNRLQ